MIHIHFNRQTSTAHHPGFDGWGGDFTATGSDAYLDIVRAMVDAGEPDCPATFVDERGMSCMTVRSIRACARRYRPNEREREDRKARVEAKRATGETGAGGG